MGPAGRLVTIKRSGADGPHFPLSLSSCLFGRGVECDIRIQLPVVSRQHCKIEVKEQKAVLFNFSSANPTQVNGSAIDGPVQLRHGDVITVVDRSFRYEDDRRQSGSTSAAFPGQRHGQAAPRRASRSSFSSDPDGGVEGRDAARSQLPEADCVSGEPPARVEGVGLARAVSRSSAGPATRSPPDGHRSGPLRGDRRHSVGSPAGGLGEGSRGTLVSKNGGPEALPSPWCLEKGGEKESPFRKLYESMKEKLDVKSEKENVLQTRRKSGSRGHCAADSESAGGSWGETPPQGSPKCRRRSRRSSQTKAVLAPGQREEERTGEGPGLALEAPASPSTAPMETMKGGTPEQGGTPGRRSHQNSSRKRRSGGQGGVRGPEPANLEQSAALTPKQLFPGRGAPPEGQSADGFGSTPEEVFSRKRRSSFPPKADVLAAETEIPKPAVLTPLLAHVERKGPGGSLGAAAGSPGLNAIDVSNLDESICKMEGVPLKTRRVSFGGRLRPELFDENLPPNTPLKRGETPMKRRSLVTHAPAVLKKTIKGQPQESGKEGSSEIRLEVTAQNVFASSPACRPAQPSAVANGDRRRSSQPPAPSGSPSPPEPDAPKRGARRSGGAPSQRASLGRSRHGILQLVHSRRRSGASEANLIVAKSWADIVKLSAKQTQAKAVKRGPPRQPSKRPRRANTPKKPTGHVYSEFSTGHANSPCTIVIGKAHVEKVTVPARPYRMLNSLVFNKKIDFSEDLSGLTEMFKTPAKGKPKKMSLRLATFSNSEGLFGKQFQVPKSDGKPLPGSPAKSGENVLPSAQNAPEEPSDKKSASPALRRQCGTVNKNMRTPPSETEPSKTASSGNKSRRSAGLRNSQAPGAECEQGDPEFDTAESILGRCLRKSPAQAQLVEGEVKEREGAFAVWERSIESKENSEKRMVVRRSRRSSELNCAPRTDVIAMRRLQETESKEDLVGIRCFPQTPGHAEAPVAMESEATTVCCRSPKPEPVSTPAKTNGRGRTPSQRGSAQALSVLRKPTQTPGDTKHTHTEPGGGDESMNASKKTPEQQQNSAEHVIGSRRRPRTPKKKPQSTEDLAGLKELFQTPNHVLETVTKDKTTEVPSKSPKPEPVSTPSSTKRGLRTPLRNVDVEEELSALRKSTPTPGETTHSPGDPEGDDEDIRALKGTPEQKLDSAERVIGSRRRSRTPKRKVEPTEDLTGFTELFQTPNHVLETVTKDKTTKVPSKSPKPEPVSTPTSTKRHLRTPLRKVEVEEELSGLRKSTPTPGETTHSPGDPEGDDEDIGALKGTPEQKLDSAERVIGSRRRSRTPKRKVEPTEDLTGFTELFQTPNHVLETVTKDKTTEVPSKSPKPEPVSTPTSTKRHLRTPLRNVEVEEELSALRKSTPTPGETTHSPGDPEGDDEDIRALKGTPEQKWDSAECVIGRRRRSRTPTRKVEPTEDLTGFTELFQTPSHTVVPVTEDKTMKMPSKSPKPAPVSTPSSTKRGLRTPLRNVEVEEGLSALRKSTPTPGETTHSPGDPEGDDEDIGALKGTPEQKLDSAERVIGSRRRSRTPKRKVEPTEDLTGFTELFQTPDHIVVPVTEDKTMKMPSKSPKPAPVSTPTSTKRRLRTPLRNVEVEEELSALRKSTPTPGETTHSPGDPEGDDEDIRALKGTPEQERDSAEQVTRSRRRSRTPTGKVEPTEDLTGFKELFQTPSHIVVPVTEDKTMKMPSKSPKPAPVSTPTSTKRGLRTPLGNVEVEEELSALRKSTLSPGETTHSPRDPEGDDKDIRALKGTPEQERDSAERVTGSRRRSRTPSRVNQPIEDLAGFKELFQTPRHTVESMMENKATEMPCKSAQAKPAVMPTGRNRRLKAPPGKVAAKDELSVLWSPARPSSRTTRLHREPEGGDKDMKLSKESPERKLDPAENVTASKRRPRTRKEKAQFLEDAASLKELLQVPSHTGDPVAVANSTETSSGSPQAEAVVMPARTRRQLKAPPGTVAVQEEPSGLRRPTGTSGKTMRSHREPEGVDKDMKLSKESPERKLDPAENVTASKRRPRTRKEKAQFLEDAASLKELLQVPSHTGDPVAIANSTETPSGSPQAEAVVMPARTRRQLKAPPGTVAVQEEPSGLRRPTGTSGKTMRSHREPVVGAKDTEVCKGPPRREPGPAGNAVGSGRLLRSRKGRAQPPHSPAHSKQLLQSPAQDKELGTDAVGATRTSAQTPDQSKPVTTSRRAVRALNRKATEELVDSRDPVKSQSESSVTVSPKRKREDGSCAGPRRLRPRTHAQDAAEEKPPRKRQRTAPGEQCAPPERPEPKKGRRVLREGMEPVEDLPSTHEKTKNKGRKEDVTAPDKGMSLRSRLPNKSKGAERRPEPLVSAEKAQRTRNEEKPGKPSQEVRIQNPEGGAQTSAPGDTVHERRMSPRPGRRGEVPVPRGAEEEEARARSVEARGKTREKEGAPRSGSICLRSRKVAVPPSGDTLESQSKPRVTRSAKRPVEDAGKEKDNECVKKMRPRSRRGQ